MHDTAPRQLADAVLAHDSVTKQHRRQAQHPVVVQGHDRGNVEPQHGRRDGGKQVVDVQHFGGGVTDQRGDRSDSSPVPHGASRGAGALPKRHGRGLGGPQLDVMPRRSQECDLVLDDAVLPRRGSAGVVGVHDEDPQRAPIQVDAHRVLRTGDGEHAPPIGCIGGPSRPLHDRGTRCWS